MSEEIIIKSDTKRNCSTSFQPRKSFSYDRSRQDVTQLLSSVNLILNPPIQIPQRKHAPWYRQWFYCFHYYFHPMGDVPENQESSAAQTLEKEQSLLLKQNDRMPVFSALAAYCWNVFCEIVWSEISFAVLPAGFHMLCGIALGCGIIKLHYTIREISRKPRSRCHPTSDPDSQVSISNGGPKKSNPPVENETGDHFFENVKDVSTECTNNNHSENVFFDRLNNNKEQKRIENILDREMKISSYWQDLPYHFTSNMLHLKDDISFVINGVTEMLGYYLHQELEPILIFILSENIQNRIYARISTNMSGVFCWIFDVLFYLTPCLEDWHEEFQTPSSAWNRISAYPSDTPPRARHSKKSDRVFRSTKRRLTSVNEYKTSSHAKVEKPVATCQVAESSNMIFNSHLASCHLETGCIVLPDLHQTESCLRIIWRNTLVPLSDKRILEVKSYIFKRIDTTSVTSTSGKVPSREGKQPLQSKRIVINKIPNILI